MKLLEFRQKMGASQQKLAELLGVGSAVVGLYETGKRKPSYEVLKKLFELGATVEELFGVAYKPDKPLLEASDLSPEKAAEIVRAGLKYLYGNN